MTVCVWRFADMRKLFLLPLFAPLLAWADSGADVAVIYNSRSKDSKDVADYYAERRSVPTNQVWGFDMSTTEAITRAEYVDKIQTPILKKLEETKLWTWSPGTNEGRRLASAKIKYLAICYGVPTKFLQDTNLVEKGTETSRPELRRTEGSVDSQLACLPLVHHNLRWAGALNNQTFGATNAAFMHPMSGILLVTRIDGPTPELAAGLIDRAITAETNGLWGRAYIDSRGFTNGPYQSGDEWMRTTAQLARRWGFETDLDQDAATYPVAYPMSQIAFYAGWYDWNASGPLGRQEVEFMPGAFAYHLHSFSAQTLRSTNQNWVGPLIAKGAAATIGNVDEPYLGATTDLPIFFSRFVMMGFSFGEAAWAAQNSLSWQTIAVGDPLYRPFARSAEELHRDLERRKLALLEWSHLRVVNANLASGQSTVDELIGYLEEPSVTPVVRQSAVLTEKLADLYWAKKKLSDALDYYEAALKRFPSPQQKQRIMLLMAHRRAMYGPDEKAVENYQAFLKEFPNYPDKLTIYQKLLPLAEKTGDKAVVERCRAEIKKLGASAAQ
jgi:uncharacterized protein (TIGR03790 family)